MEHGELAAVGGAWEGEGLGCGAAVEAGGPVGVCFLLLFGGDGDEAAVVDIDADISGLLFGEVGDKEIFVGVLLDLERGGVGGPAGSWGHPAEERVQEVARLCARTLGIRIPVDLPDHCIGLRENLVAEGVEGCEVSAEQFLRGPGGIGVGEGWRAFWDGDDELGVVALDAKSGVGLGLGEGEALFVAGSVGSGSRVKVECGAREADMDVGRFGRCNPHGVGGGVFFNGEGGIQHRCGGVGVLCAGVGGEEWGERQDERGSAGEEAF